jgi:hypothetical protein
VLSSAASLTAGSQTESVESTKSSSVRIFALTGITPVLISEISASDHRGGFLGYVFIANYLGISVAYWLSFGVSFIENGNSVIRWRFLLKFQ